MILLKDGEKYLACDYSSEEELTKMVVEHYKDLFGPNALYFDPQTMKTHIGIATRSDGIIIRLDKNLWYLLEVELAEHPLHRHIIPQITKFNIAYQQPETRRKITDALYTLIRQDVNKKAALQAQKTEDIHKFLTEIIETSPTIAIVIDQSTLELDAISKNLPFPTRVTEFKTYKRGSIHIHEFEPLYEEPQPPKSLEKVLKVLEQIYAGKTYGESVKIVAKKLKLYHGTVRAACTRDIGLPATKFRKLIKDKERLRVLLIEKYPEYESIIVKTIA